MIFSGNPSLTYGTSTIPKLIGWKFYHTNAENGFVCNFSTDTFALSLAGVFPNPMQYEQYFADTALLINGLSSVNKISGNSTDTVIIYPYSFTQIYTSVPATIQNQQEHVNITLFPIPFSTQTVIYTDNFLKNATLTVDNVLGQPVKQIKNISGQRIILHRDNLPGGLYFVRLTDDTEVISTLKIVVAD
jgi:hypothetical protein